MADMMRGKGAIPSTREGQGAIGAMKDNMSAFNPVDRAAMKSPGHPGYMDPQKTTVRQYFEQNGVDVDGPIIQLVKFAQDQATKANPINKMVNIGRAGQEKGAMVPGGPAAPAGGQAPQAQGSSLEDIMAQLGGSE